MESRAAAAEHPALIPSPLRGFISCSLHIPWVRTTAKLHLPLRGGDLARIAHRPTLTRSASEAAIWTYLACASGWCRARCRTVAGAGAQCGLERATSKSASKAKYLVLPRLRFGLVLARNKLWDSAFLRSIQERGGWLRAQLLVAEACWHNPMPLQ
jgi:hypothetical protein